MALDDYLVVFIPCKNTVFSHVFTSEPAFELHVV